jgi:hypothetical protein
VNVAARKRNRFRNARYNDIEFSGERKRVRCNELLGGSRRLSYERLRH